MAAPMDEHLIIGLQPEYRIQESPFDVAQRMASTRESFENKAPGTGLGERASAPLFLDKVPASAAPTSSNYNGLVSELVLPRVSTSGTKIQGPNDGPTYLINKAELVEAAYDGAIIMQVNDMLSKENYSGAEVLLGRELSTEEVQNRQLGPANRYVQAQAGIPANRFPQKVIPMPPNASNPPPLPPNVRDNAYGGTQSNPNNGTQWTYEQQKNNPFYPKTGAEQPTGEFNTRKREEDFVEELEKKAKQDRADIHSLEGKIPIDALHRAQAAADRQTQYAEQRRQALAQQTGHGIQFGRFTVHAPKLEQGILSMKYTHSGKKITDLPNKKLHPALQQAVHDVVHGAPTSGTGLSDKDVSYLHKIVARSQSGGKANIPLPASQRQRSRMLVVMGEMEAGNDNPELKDELAKLVSILAKAKNITRGEALLIRQNFL